MNQMTDIPSQRNFGLDFNYASWNADTVITLTNVSWSNTYRDIVQFANQAALDSYINDGATSTRIEGVSYAIVNQPVRLNIAFNDAYRFNYLRATNPASPGSPSSRSFYYFITDVQYVAPKTTQITVQLDVWQTFGRDVSFGNCYVERGHIGIANENNFNNYGRDYLTVPEGLDVGGEYQVVAKRSKDVISNYVNPEAEDPFQQFAVLVASTIDLRADAGDVDKPKLVTAQGGRYSGLPSGASYYVFKGGIEFGEWLKGMQEKPWVTQGIISIKLIPDIKRYYPAWEYATGAEIIPGQTPEEFNSRWFKSAPEEGPLPLLHAMFENWRNSADVSNYIPAEYRRLNKLRTYPYMAIELTTWGGTPVVLKPESWNNDNADVIELASLVPPAEKLIFSPRNYNSRAGAGTDQRYPGIPIEIAPRNQGDDNGEYLDVITQIANFPSMALVNNGAIGFMAANAASIPQQHRSASWDQQKALQGAQTSYNQTAVGLGAANENLQTNRSADTRSTYSDMTHAANTATTGMVRDVAGGAINGAFAGPAGVAAGVTGGAVSAVAQGFNTVSAMQNTTQQLGIRDNTQRKLNDNSQRVGNYVANTNKLLAEISATGDYQNQIGAISARVQDAQLTQPSISGQIGGETITLVNNDMKISVRVKMIDVASIRRIGDFWNRYGYAVNQFVRMPASLMVMANFTYWKLTETYIIAAPMPETFKQAIRGIFEKGVTVWSDPNNIGTINISDNPTLGGIRI